MQAGSAEEEEEADDPEAAAETQEDPDGASDWWHVHVQPCALMADWPPDLYAYAQMHEIMML